jgi:group I intron endonuclease
MIIYRILNTINNKSYVGQTKFDSFKNRYWGKWYNSTHNVYLKRSVKKYGEKNFAIQILEQNVLSYDLLNKFEKFYIKKYNSLYPNGYNFTEGGNKNHAHHLITKL